MGNENISTHLIGILCLWHFILTPFFLFIRDYRRYAYSYLAFCGLIAVGEIACLMTLPESLGFAGLPYLYVPVISFIVAVIPFGARTIKHAKEEQELRYWEAVRLRDDIASGRIPPPPQHSPRPLVPPPPPTPQQLRKEAIRDSFVIVVAGLAVVAYLLRQVAMATGVTIEPSIGRLLLRVLFVEIVWQVWARSLSAPTALLRQQPRSYHIVMIVAATLISTAMEFAPLLTVN